MRIHDTDTKNTKVSMSPQHNLLGKTPSDDKPSFVYARYTEKEEYLGHSKDI